MKSRYLYKLDYYIKPEKFTQFQRSFSKVIKAQKEHERGLGDKIKLYRTFVGGKNVVTFIVPMDSLSEMDNWMHVPKMINEFYGSKEGIKILMEYSYAIDRTQSSIVKRYKAD